MVSPANLTISTLMFFPSASNSTETQHAITGSIDGQVLLRWEQFMFTFSPPHHFTNNPCHHATDHTNTVSGIASSNVSGACGHLTSSQTLMSYHKSNNVSTYFQEQKPPAKSGRRRVQVNVPFLLPLEAIMDTSKQLG